MGKSTHPFVIRMNEAKAFHRAMRAGAEKETPKPDAKPDPAPEPPPTGKRYVTLERKTPTAVEPKGVLAIVVPK